MKKLGEILISKQPVNEIVMGNTAVVRAMIETGVKVAASYPGSPTPEIAEAIKSIPSDKRPFYFEFSVNEKVATEIAFGASVNGHFSVVFFKSVGLNVAADSFVQLGHLELIGGMLIILGDDPGANSSQNEQDNRHYAHLSYIPVFEPSSPKEIYSMFKEAAKLSQERKMPVILRLTTHVCHAKEKVSFAAIDKEIVKQSEIKPMFNAENGPYIPITSAVFPLKRRALSKLDGMADYADKSPSNIMLDNGNETYGVITMGLPYLSLMDVLSFAEKKPDILKLGIIHPVPRKLIADFLKAHREVKILEELDNVIEKETKVIAFEEHLNMKIIGKIDYEDWIGEYTPGKVYTILEKTWKELLPKRPGHDGKAPSVPQRPAQLCPGCGHRSAFYSIKKALKENDITVADIGCHSLGFLPPYKMGEVLLCMGHSTATGSGLSLYNSERKVVAFIGDSTFFHAGIPGIINAVFNKHNLTLVVMENGTTAMTGHQEHPGTGKNFNEITEKIPIKQVLSGLGIKNIRETDTYNQEKLISMIKEAVNEEGFKVVIAKHPCMLKFTREQRRKGVFNPVPAFIDNNKCTMIHECVSVFGCPSFQIQISGSVRVNKDLCIGDGSCLKTCKSSAIELKKE